LPRIFADEFSADDVFAAVVRGVPDMAGLRFDAEGRLL
jgi:hypothetical protein